MLTPLFVELILGDDIGPWAYGGFIIGIAVVVFIVLQVLTMTFLTGTFSVSLPRIFNNLGSAVVSFILVC